MKNEKNTFLKMDQMRPKGGWEIRLIKRQSLKQPCFSASIFGRYEGVNNDYQNTLDGIREAYERAKALAQRKAKVFEGQIRVAKQGH